mgnify:CR=1 FL=1
MKKNIKLLVSISVIFIILGIFLVFYENTKKEDVTDTKKISDYEQIDISDYLNQEGSKSLKVGENIIKIESHNSDVIIYEKDEVLFLADKDYLKMDSVLHRYGDSFVFSVNDIQQIYLFDANDGSIRDFSSFSRYNLISKTYKVEKDKIIIEATSMREDTDEIYVDAMENISINSCELFHKYQDNMVEATIEIPYLGNGIFDEYKIVDSKTLKDVEKYQKLCE